MILRVNFSTHLYYNCSLLLGWLDYEILQRCLVVSLRSQVDRATDQLYKDDVANKFGQFYFNATPKM